MTDIAAYYDGFADRLLADWQNNNPRVVAALEFATEHLFGSILDVGCGIGWSSAVLSSVGSVLGVDISPRLIGLARETFGDKAEFRVADFTRDQIPGRFDGVFMGDVYEHFPRSSRPAVHKKLTRILRGNLVVAVPTPEALQYARDNGIALQPVDEDVTDNDIQRLADDIGGRVIVNRKLSVWRPDDYRHVLIVND